MIKHFCDTCGAEIGGNHSEITGEATLGAKESKRPYKFAVIIRLDLPADEAPAELCADCVFRAVGQLDPRPKEG
jgi:hypothetical protein